MHAKKLLISLKNSRDRSFETEIMTTSAKTKTTKFQSRAVSRPRPQSRGLSPQTTDVNQCDSGDWCENFLNFCAERFAGPRNTILGFLGDGSHFMG